MAQHSSRLHRLLTLLDTGSTQATRFAAARQIGDIAKSHPQDLNSLLKKVSQYLRSRSWDTRVAAAHAVGAIAENVKHTSLKEFLESIEAEMLVSGISDVSNEMGMIWSNFHPNIVAGLSFESFNINKVLEFGSPLLASGGQAMDRAHRLGQRKVVNVHCLIMRGTLEEKVMSLQKFKVSVVNAVINAENASLKTMNTDQLLDLFTPAPTTRKGPGLSSSSNGTLDGDLKSMVGGKGLKGILSGLGELWDQSQYADEYNLSQFLAKLNG